jgi:hypothetical protein
MADSIAALKNLQALCLVSARVEFNTEAMTPLAKIKNLKHLSIQSGSIDDSKIMQSILLNSTSTLQSLAIETNSYAVAFLKDWEAQVSTNDALAKQKYRLKVLKSFTLCNASFDAPFVSSLQTAIDFMGLRELSLGPLSTGSRLFFQLLTELATTSKDRGTAISLRSLSIDMSNETYGGTLDPTQFDAKCRFISAFDTLTTLEIKDYNQYPESITTNPGLSNTLLEAILTHKSLTCLKISYAGIMGNRKIPYLSATTVATIIDNLPQLQMFEFAPEEAEIVRTSWSKSFVQPTNTSIE